MVRRLYETCEPAFYPSSLSFSEKKYSLVCKIVIKKIYSKRVVSRLVGTNMNRRELNNLYEKIFDSFRNIICSIDKHWL
jgi:hypothetical protein